MPKSLGVQVKKYEFWYLVVENIKTVILLAHWCASLLLKLNILFYRKFNNFAVFKTIFRLKKYALVLQLNYVKEEIIEFLWK